MSRTIICAIIRSYKDFGSYVRRNRKLTILILLAIAEFVVFSILNTEAESRYLEYAESTMPEYSGLFTFIFFENLGTMLRMLAAGLIPLGLGSLFMTYLVIRNLTAAIKWFLLYIPPKEILLLLLPHSLLEIPAVIFTMMLSFYLSRESTILLYRLIFRREKLRQTDADLRTLCMTFVLGLLPGVLGAAVLECWPGGMM